MSDVKIEPTIVSANIPIAKAPDFKDIYSNYNRIGVSPVDFNITFSKIIEPLTGMNSIEDQAVIRMSAQQFKSFLEILQQKQWPPGKRYSEILRRQ